MADIYSKTPLNRALLDEVKNNAYVPEIGPELGFTDTIGLAFQEFTLNTVTPFAPGPKFIEAEALREQRNIIAKHKLDLELDIDLRLGLTNWKDQTDKIRSLQQQHPGLGLKTFDELKTDIDNIHAKVEREYQHSLVNTSYAGKIGSFVGAMGGFLTDPLNVAATALPFGLGATSLPKIALAEGVINTALAGLSEPAAVANRALIGIETTAPQAVQEIAIQGVVGGILGGALGGIGRLFNPITKATIESINKFDGLVKKPVEGTLAAEALKDTLETLSSKPSGLSQTEYMLALKKANDDLINGRPVNIESIIPDANKGSLPEEILLQETSENSKFLTDTMETTINDVRNNPDLSNLEVPTELTADGKIVLQVRSVKEVLAEAEQDIKSFKLLDTCLRTGKGAPNVN